MKHISKLSLIPFAALMMIHCASSIDQNLLSPGNNIDDSRERVGVQYLGSGGFVFEWRGKTIMTAPFFTNTGIASQALKHNCLYGDLFPMRSSYSHVDKHAEKIKNAMIQTDAILVGHGHYDHALDLPYLLKCHSGVGEGRGNRRIPIYGNTALKTSLDSYKETKVYKNLKCAADPNDEWFVNQIEDPSSAPKANFQYGKPFPVAGGTMRITAVHSMHAPHMFGIDLLKVCPGRNSPPARACDWREGDTLAYVIDFMEGERIKFRIYYQDAASEPPRGFLPAEKDGSYRKADLVILTMAAFKQVDTYPEGLLKNTNPKYVIAAHWEDFFQKYDPEGDELEVVRGTDRDEFVDRLVKGIEPGTQWFMPKLYAKFSFKVE